MVTEAGWTREKPTVAGWYWWRSLNGMIGPEIIQIDNTNGPDTDLEVIGPFGETPLDEWIAESEDEPGEWQGPLSPDSYQQGRVAGLTFAAEQAGKGAELWDAGMKPREAEALREFQRWLQGKAQQAQDEKEVGDA